MRTFRHPFGRLHLAVLALLITCNAGAQGTDQCRDFLQQGIRDEYSVTSSVDMRSAFKSGFCNSTSNSSGSTTGGGLGVSVPLADAILGVKANYNQDQKQEMSGKYCGNSSSSLSDDDYVSMMKRIASVAVVQTWSQ